MGISIVLAVGAPVCAFLIPRKKFNLKAVPLFSGAAAFVLFALILERTLHQIVLKPDAAGNIELASRPVLYMLYGGLAAGVFEETARFASFRLLKKKYGGIGTALSYGIGHGGFEAVLIGGLTMIGNLAISVMINRGADVPLLSGEQLTALVSTKPPVFLMGGIERVFALIIQISLSVLVWYAVTGKGKLWLFPAAVGLHALIDFAPALYQAGVVKNIYLLESGVAVSAAVAAWLAYYTHKKVGSFK